MDLDDGNRTCLDYAAAGHLPYTVAEVVAAIRARKPPPEPPKGVHGRRAAGYVQLNLTVRPEVKRRLEAVARESGVSMAELLDELLDRHLPK